MTTTLFRWVRYNTIQYNTMRKWYNKSTIVFFSCFEVDNVWLRAYWYYSEECPKILQGVLYWFLQRSMDEISLKMHQGIHEIKKVGNNKKAGSVLLKERCKILQWDHNCFFLLRFVCDYVKTANSITNSRNVL